MKKFYAKILKNAENDNIDRLILENEFGNRLLNFSKNHSPVKSAKSKVEQIDAPHIQEKFENNS